jgi:hypothetical protein
MVSMRSCWLAHTRSLILPSCKWLVPLLADFASDFIQNQAQLLNLGGARVCGALCASVTQDHLARNDAQFLEVEKEVVTTTNEIRLYREWGKGRRLSD